MPRCIAQSVSGAKQAVRINVEPERWHFQSLSEADHESVRDIDGVCSRWIPITEDASHVPLARELFLCDSQGEYDMITIVHIQVRTIDRIGSAWDPAPDQASRSTSPVEPSVVPEHVKLTSTLDIPLAERLSATRFASSGTSRRC